MPEEQNDFTYIANAWKKQAKNGKIFLSLSFKYDVKAGTPVWMYPNENKRPEHNDPDWSLSARTDDVDLSSKLAFTKKEEKPF